MKNKWFLLAIAVLPVFFSGCGLSIYEDWKKSGGKAITGAGAVAGKDYITGLTPSENSRKYFARISGGDQPLETVSRSDEGESKSGVKFVKNGGILIPPGVTISFENKGYCMDPNLPAPKAGDEYQLIPMTQLIPEDLQGMYKKLVTKASAGDESVQRNMQHLVWALRTAGTDAAYANNLTKEQKKILDRCGEYPGQFEEFNANAKSNGQALKELVGLADSFLNIKIGGVSYKASDLLDPDVGNKKINEHIDQLIGMSARLPVEKSGFNFGEIQPGIYTDVQGTGYMQFRAKIANSTNQPFVFYPTDYVGQVGSPTKNGAVASYAAADTSMRQRITGGNPDKADVEDKREPDDNQELPPFCKLPKDQREKLLKYAYYAKYAYQTPDTVWLDGAGGRILYDGEPGYQDFKRIKDLSKASGFDFEIFKDENRKDTVIAMRGTEEMEDLWADGQLAWGHVDQQNFWAEKLVREVLDRTEGNVILTGHSLGGYEAAAAAIKVNNDRITGVYTYNSPGFRESVLSGFDKNALNSFKNKITNVYDYRDTINKVGQHWGKNTKIRNTSGLWDSFMSNIPAHDHFIDTMIKRMEACKGK